MRNMNTKALTMSLLVAIIMLLPFAASAQRSDSFFSGFEDDDYENRIAFIGLGNQPFGTEPAPVGSGLLVLTVAGAGYAALRRKRSDKSGKSRKTYTTCVLALAMVLAFTGCKKKIEPVVHDNGNSVNITLNVNGGGRHGIVLDQESGYSPVAYREGDVIYVGDGSSYVGSLTCQSDGTTFTGTITPSPTADNLYFYYVGGLTPQNWVGETSFTVDIHDQSNTNTAMDNTNKLPVLSVGTEDYYSGKVEFDCILENKCALVKFRLLAKAGEDGLANVRISNMLTEAKIDFANPNQGIAPTGTLDAITLYCGPSNNGEQTVTNMYLRWAILLPSDAERSGYIIVEEMGNNFKFYKETTIPEINPEDVNYLYGPLALNNNTTNETTDPLFVVSENYNVVRFSPGNIQYQASTNTWRFANNQYDYVGGTIRNITGIGNVQYGNVYENSAQCTNASIASNYSGWIDLFGWGTWSNGKDPWEARTENQYYQGSAEFNHTIVGDANDDWRILTQKEWANLSKMHNLKRKIGAATIEMGDEKINYVRGKLILPYNWVGSPELGTTNGWKATEITTEEWASYWLVKGAVFLPVDGYRNGTSVLNSNQYSTNSSGMYWSVTPYNNDQMCYASFSSSATITTGNYVNKFLGCSIRLVR